MKKSGDYSTPRYLIQPVRSSLSALETRKLQNRACYLRHVGLSVCLQVLTREPLKRFCSCYEQKRRSTE
jgi:hypothetical protein